MGCGDGALTRAPFVFHDRWKKHFGVPAVALFTRCPCNLCPRAPRRRVRAPWTKATDERRTVLIAAPRPGPRDPRSVVNPERDAPATIWRNTDLSLDAPHDDDYDYSESSDDDCEEENAPMEAANEVAAECRTANRALAELDAQQMAAIGKFVNLETGRRVDSREAAWRARCAKKTLDADRNIDKVREYSSTNGWRSN